MPPDAVFCHKCGKPQREVSAHEPQPEVSVEFTPLSAPPPAQPAQAAAPNFRNPAAVKISLLVAFIATAVGLLLPFLNWVAAGFFSVFFYRKKMRGLLTVNAGLNLGWITGVIMFVMWTVIFGTLTATGQVQKIFEQQLANFPQNDASVQQAIRFLESGPGVAIMLVFWFVLITCFSMAGGALGAKLVGRE